MNFGMPISTVSADRTRNENRSCGASSTGESRTRPVRRRDRIRSVRLPFLLLLLATWTAPAARHSDQMGRIDEGLRPNLYNRGLPVSEAFEAYLEAHFSPDPRRRAARADYPIVTKSGAKNCVLLIGDGMGLAHVTAAALASRGVNGRLAMQRMPIVGLVMNASASSVATDSGAAATGMATGFRTYNGAVAVDPDGQPLESYFLTAQRHGKRIGLVVSSSVVGGTPAPFFANAEWRSLQTAIAPQLIERGINVIFGGGIGYFLPKSHLWGLSLRRDERDLFVEAMRRGYKVSVDPDELATLSGDHVMGLYGVYAMPTADISRPTLVEMTAKALDLLSEGDRGFCLLVEGSQIDWQSHAGNFEGMLWETLEFDRAIAYCLEFAARDGDTLVLVTADHETGGLGLSAKDTAALSAYWTTGGHTAIMVPLWAYGPGCLEFAGNYANIDIAVKIASVLGLDDFPALRGQSQVKRKK